MSRITCPACGAKWFLPLFRQPYAVEDGGETVIHTPAPIYADDKGNEFCDNDCRAAFERGDDPAVRAESIRYDLLYAVSVMDPHFKIPRSALTGNPADDDAWDGTLFPRDNYKIKHKRKRKPKEEA